MPSGKYLIDPPEAELLERAAAGVPHAGVIVEIGSYHGGSTLALARGARRSGARVYAIDPHEHVERDTICNRDVVFSLSDNTHFMRNVVNADVADIVLPITLPSQYAYKALEAIPDFGIDLLFIDGAHDFARVTTDFVYYGKLLRRGGAVLFHDSEWDGVKPVIAAALVMGWQVTDRVASISVLRRIQE